MKLAGFLSSIIIGGSVFGTPTPTDPLAVTIVSGVVYGNQNTPVSSGSVDVTCGSATQTVAIKPDGSYQATFQQTQCKAGDTASGNANTTEGNGANSAPVKNTALNGPAVDIDISVVNINVSVPEFGMLTGLLSLAGASGSFFYHKLKSVA